MVCPSDQTCLLFGRSTWILINNEKQDWDWRMSLIPIPLPIIRMNIKLEVCIRIQLIGDEEMHPHLFEQPRSRFPWELVSTTISIWQCIGGHLDRRTRSSLNPKNRSEEGDTLGADDVTNQMEVMMLGHSEEGSAL
eukprot:TRINITY_DN280_c0_g1_i10.p1 TRINITY_DN280_c0_g1~~TRINITY_DN280_c0_g1_i10.p1  ORF type:complete len:136 (-),score=17.43 TRINITY_DN280_c0_g1_i10:431-838(-)